MNTIMGWTATKSKHSVSLKGLVVSSMLGLLLTLTGCGGGGGSSNPPTSPTPTPTPTTQSIHGAGVKGPLIGAVVTVYAIDYSVADRKGPVIATGSTNNAAQITGVALPLPLAAPYLMEITSDADTVDITTLTDPTDPATGSAPVIKTLRTVITDAMLSSGINLYATPQTTLATDIALNKATDDSSLLAELPNAATAVMSALGFGASSSVDIFTTPPLINSASDTTEEQAAVAEYRMAIEALGAALANAAAAVGGSTTADSLMADLVSDLADGVIDNVVDPAARTEILNADPGALTIPGTSPAKTVRDVTSILVDEKATTGSTTDTKGLSGGTITIDPKPAEADTDKDGDGILNITDLCPDIANPGQEDNNTNLIGDACEATPVISGTPSTSIDEGSAYSFTPTASDGDGDTLNFIISGQPSWASFDTTTGTLSGTPGFTDAAIYTDIIISVSDGSVNPAVALPAFSITVNNVNAPPAIGGVPATSINEDSLYSFTPTISDVDGGTLTCSAPSIPTWAGFDVPSCTLSGTPTNDNVGTHSGISLCVTDGTDTVCLPDFSIVVMNTNDAPTISGTPSTSVDEDSAYNFIAITGDVDISDTLTCSGVNVPVWASITTGTNTCVMSGTPTNSHVGTYNNIQVCVNDGTVTACTTAFNVTVNNTPDAPVISGTPLTTATVGINYSFTPSASDPDVGDTLVFSITNQPTWSAFSTTTGELSGIPGAGDVGITTTGVEICVTDQAGAGTTVCLPMFDLAVSDVSVLPDLTGIWRSSVTSVVTPATCTSSGGAGSAQFLLAEPTLKSYVSIFQSGTSLDLIFLNGITTTGTIATDNSIAVTNKSTMFVDAALLLSSFGMEFSNINYIPGSNTIVGRVKNTSTNGASSCSQTLDFSAEYVYKPTGAENYSGVYQMEALGRNDDLSQWRVNPTMQFDFVRSIGSETLTLGEITDNTFSVRTDPVVFNHTTGTAFVQSVYNRVKDLDNDGVADDLQHEVQNFYLLFPRSPSDSSGLPVVAFSGFTTFQQWMNTTTYTEGSMPTPDFTENEVTEGYGRIATQTSLVRSNHVPLSGGTEGDYVVMGITFPPLVVDNGAATVVELRDDTDTTVVCSTTYGGRYTQRFIPFPSSTSDSPDMTAEAFSSWPYSWVTCPVSTTASTPIVDGNTYYLHILKADNSDVAGSPYPIVATPTTFATSIPNRRQIDIGGAKSSKTRRGDPIRLHGFFGTSGDLPVVVPASTDPDISAYFLQFSPADIPADAPDMQFRIESASNSFAIPASLMTLAANDDFDMEMRLTERYDRSGRIAQSHSRYLRIQPGIRAMVNFEMVDGSNQYRFQLWLNGRTENPGSVECVVAHPLDGSLTCSPGTINYAANKVTVPINVGGSPLSLEMTFSDSINASASIVGTTVTGSALIVNPEILFRSELTYDSGTSSFVPRTVALLHNMIPKFDVGTISSVTLGQDLLSTPGSSSFAMFNGDYASKYSSFTDLPFDGVLPQSTGSQIVYNGPPGSSSLLSAPDDIAITVSQSTGSLTQTYRDTYPVANPPVANLVPPTRAQITVNGTAATGFGSAMELTTQPITLVWPHTTTELPADVRWRAIMREVDGIGNPIPHTNVRTKRYANGDTDGPVYTPGTPGTWTWTLPADFKVPSTGVYQLFLRVSNPGGDVRGRSQSFFLKDQAP